MTGAETSGSLADHAFEAVKQMIFNFELIPGERFSESELTARLRVSRTPLRQALQRLAVQGLLQVYPKMGWLVAPIDFNTMDELYDLRILLETNAVSQLADSPDLSSLNALEARWLLPVDERLTESSAVGQLDEAFHTYLVAACGNREITRVHQEITDRIRLIRRLDFTKQNRIQATYDEHGRILRALLARRKDEAKRLLRARIELSKLEVRKITLDALFKAKQKRAAEIFD